MVTEHDDLLDPNNIVYGEDNKIQSIFDPETKTMFGEDLLKEHRGQQQQQQQNIPEEELVVDDEGGEGNEVEFTNFADLVINKIMGHQIEIPQDLSDEEQAKIVTQGFKDTIDFYDKQIADLRKQGAALTPYERELISALRSGQPLDELLGESGGQEIELDDKDSVVRYDIMAKNPSWTEQEVTEELDHIKSTNRFERHYKTAKDNLLSAQQEYSQKGNKSTYQEQLRQLEIQEQLETEKEIATIGKVLESTAKIYDFELDNDMRILAYRYATEINPKTGTTYLQEHLSTPEGVAELALLKLYGKQIIDYMRTESFKAGKRELLKKFPNTPIHTQKNDGGNGGGNAYTYDLNKLDLVEQIGND